ncbi:MAG: DUF4199 domain-containing protein [Gillisia sp.]|nr:DUF4199 domain-containing protein [Gillisia sp.]
MEVQKLEAKKFVLNYGILLGILSVIMGVIMYVTNAYIDPSLIYTAISFLILIGVITFGINDFKRENSGFLNIGDALKVGIGIAVIGGIITAVWSYLLINYIEPDYMLQMMDVSREKIMESDPNLTDAEMNTIMEMSAKFRTPWMIMAISLIGNLFFGLVISLISGLIMKNENPYEEA